ncbi:porin family protein [Sphingobacterium faecium]|uniref:porin family protein n=1 Tax=Sphingobacterium faecium TaxID=34087 RepID=UPI002469BC3A|nr:porin family protein [Sphingobacterium faecium]MDH5825666.1 porin family protein [Sphingobacterium faecium]
MKKLLLTLGAAFLLAAGAQAQSGLGYGIKAGVNMPSYSYGGSDLSDSKSTVNFHVTGYLDAPLTNNFYIQPGVSLQGKGAKFADYKIGESTYEVKQNTMWLEVPVNFVLKFPTAGEGKFFVGAGPYVSFGLSGKNKYEVKSGSGTSSTSDDFKFGKDETLKGTDFGVNFLAGYQLGSGLSINAGYGLGLTNIAGSKFLGTGDVKNRVWSIGLGFGI